MKRRASPTQPSRKPPKKRHAASPKPKKKRLSPKPQRRDTNGRFVSLKKRAAKVTLPPRGRVIKRVVTERHYDGRVNDIERVRKRITFDEAVELYGFDELELPEWLQYLPGAP